MRRLYYLSVAVLLAIVLLAACNSKDRAETGGAGGVAGGGNSATTSTTPNVPSDGVRRVTIVELRDALDKGTAIVVDTRDPATYKANHIKGSINIPLNDVANRIKELPRDKTVVAYCS
ncbi:MAG TPA: rhodanese-like domain-containing protein [Pyrinomonadaceae bacterium]|nr:rhodanese-like domain-containing protein [Pyrinomonadaceae bacterium]